MSASTHRPHRPPSPTDLQEEAERAPAAARRPQWFPIHPSERRRAPLGGNRSMSAHEQLRAFLGRVEPDSAAGGYDSETEDAPSGTPAWPSRGALGMAEDDDEEQRALSVCTALDDMDFGRSASVSSIACGADGPRAISSPTAALCAEEGQFVPCKKCRTGPVTDVATGCFTPTEGGLAHRPYLRQLSGSQFQVLSAEAE